MAYIDHLNIMRKAVDIAIANVVNHVFMCEKDEVYVSIEAL